MLVLLATIKTHQTFVRFIKLIARTKSIRPVYAIVAQLHIHTMQQLTNASVHQLLSIRVVLRLVLHVVMDVSTVLQPQCALHVLTLTCSTQPHILVTVQLVKFQIKARFVSMQQPVLMANTTTAQTIVLHVT